MTIASLEQRKSSEAANVPQPGTNISTKAESSRASNVTNFPIDPTPPVQLPGTNTISAVEGAESYTVHTFLPKPQTPTKPVSSVDRSIKEIWDEAFEQLRVKNESLMSNYEKALSTGLFNVIGSTEAVRILCLLFCTLSEIRTFATYFWRYRASNDSFVQPRPYHS